MTNFFLILERLNFYLFYRHTIHESIEEIQLGQTITKIHRLEKWNKWFINKKRIHTFQICAYCILLVSLFIISLQTLRILHYSATIFTLDKSQITFIYIFYGTHKYNSFSTHLYRCIHTIVYKCLPNISLYALNFLYEFTLSLC